MVSIVPWGQTQTLEIFDVARTVVARAYLISNNIYRLIFIAKIHRPKHQLKCPSTRNAMPSKKKFGDRTSNLIRLGVSKLAPNLKIS